MITQMVVWSGCPLGNNTHVRRDELKRLSDIHAHAYETRWYGCPLGIYTQMMRDGVERLFAADVQSEDTRNIGVVGIIPSDLFTLC